jgi:hypothetical protein
VLHPCTPRPKYLRQGEAACRAEEVLHLEVWPEAWVAWWHACSSLVIWAHRRVVEVARPWLHASFSMPSRSSKRTPMHLHAVQGAPGVFW